MTLTTTALAPEGTPASPATARVRVPLAPIVLASHWVSVPVSWDGSPARVSQTRTGETSVVNWLPVPPAAV